MDSCRNLYSFVVYLYVNGNSGIKMVFLSNERRTIKQ